MIRGFISGQESLPRLAPADARMKFKRDLAQLVRSCRCGMSQAGVEGYSEDLWVTAERQLLAVKGDARVGPELARV